MSNIYRINKNIVAVCKSESTKYGFRHLVEIFENDVFKGFGKCCYYNRTWEAFTFQSAILNALEGCDFEKELKEKLIYKVKNNINGEVV
jgi:hypothetical protein